MSQPRPIDPETLALIADVIDGVAQAHEVEALEQRMLTDAELRRVYMTYAEIHARLALSANRQAAAPVMIDRPAGRIGIARWAIAAAAVIVVGLLVVFMHDGAMQNRASMPPVAQQDIEPAAVMVGSSDVQWQGDPLTEGQQLAGRRISIAGGTMEMTFLGGASVRISGPTDLQITGPSAARLHAGRLWARMTAPGTHFKVAGPNFTVVDVGTEFGIDVYHAGGGEVHVFDGSVLVTIQGKASERLTAGQSMAIDAAGISRTITQAADARAVYMGIPAGLVDWWTFNDGTARDLIGHADGQLLGGARIESGQLMLDGVNDWMQTSMLDHEVGARTFIVWVHPENIEQRGGGVLAIESPHEELDQFDGLAFGEIHAGAWENSSDLSTRSDTSRVLGSLETTLPVGAVMLALTYEADGHITLYRNGAPLGEVHRADLAIYPGGASRLVMGKRHSEAVTEHRPAADGVDPYFAGAIDEVRLFDRALSSDQIAQTWAQGPVP